MSTVPPQPSPPPKRRRRWPLVPLALLLILAGLGAYYYDRGTRIVPAADPAISADGVVTHLVSHDGEVAVRSAIVIDAPAKRVWSVVIDYDSHSRFLPYISALTSKKLGDGVVHIEGTAHSRLWGDWPFASDMKHVSQVGPEKHQATWRETAPKGFLLNAGSWEVVPLDTKRSLLVFTLALEVEQGPGFLVRNIVMNRTPSASYAMRDEVLRRPD